MVIGLKDGMKLVGIAIVCFCAVYVCTFMLNYYLDASPLLDAVSDPLLLALYEAQVSMAQFTALISGGVLALVSFFMLLFYVKLYIERQAQQLGIMKAFGYSPFKLASRFWVFGLSVLIGCALGFGCGWASMPFIYGNMTIEGVGEIAIGFHGELILELVLAPTVAFTAIACVAAYFALRRPVSELLRGKRTKAPKERKCESERPFLTEMRAQTVRSKKLLACFFAFSCFCFAAMVQMGLSMEQLSTSAMGVMILMIGIVLAAVSMFMAITSLIQANRKNIAVMKAFGYSFRDCAFAVLGGYIPFALIGFGAGTVYQWGLLKFMVNVIFSDVAEMPDYHFNLTAFWITLVAFLACYSAVAWYYAQKINRVSVKEIMADNEI